MGREETVGLLQSLGSTCARFMGEARLDLSVDGDDYGYYGPPWYPPYRCMWCGARIEDPGLGFIEHANANQDCFIQWQDFRNNMRRESGSS